MGLVGRVVATLLLLVAAGARAETTGALALRRAAAATQHQLELGVLAGQCLDRRLPDRETLEREVAAWVTERNAAIRTIDWRFTTDDARIKLDHLYPVFHD